MAFQCTAGLTRVQIHLVLSEATPDAEGYISYAECIPSIAALASRLIDVDMQTERTEVTAIGMSHEWDTRFASHKM